MKDFRIDELKRIIREMRKTTDAMVLPHLTKKDPAIQEGLKQSANTCRQLETVFATPLMKNLLVVFGDVKQEYDKEKDEWSTEKLATGSESKAVKWINEVVHALLLKYNGKEKTSYNSDLDVFDPEHHNVDCWLAWKPEIWDIQPGQAKERKDTFRAYRDPKTNYSYEQLLDDLSNDESLQLACLLWLAYYPEVCASHDVHDVSDPFKHKGTGTSYPDYHNDGAFVGDTDQTYGQLCVKDVEAAFKQGPREFTKFMLNNLVYTGYPRNQRGKGRALEAAARRYNIGINILNSNEMDAFKATPFGTGLKDFNGIKEDLCRLGDHARKLGNEYGVFNLDASKWDYNLGDGVNALQQGLRKMKTNGQTGKLICDLRLRGNRKVYFVDGPNNYFGYIYGRQYSGYDDTTLGNSNSNRVLSTAGACATDPNYSTKVYHPLKGASVLALGDDLDIILKKKMKSAFCEYMAGKGIKLHDDEKDAYGLFFCQNRVIELPDGTRVMGYAWPRVLRSMLSKENQKSLGKYGWTLAWYQQIGKCIEFDDDFKILVNLAVAFDRDGLSLNKPIKVILQEVKKEDEAKQAAQTGKRKKARVKTTAEVLGDGNPQALGIDKDGNLDANYFEEVQRKAKTAVIPHFLEDLGFKTPNLSIVH